MSEVKQVLSVAEAMTLQRLAFEAHAQGQAWNAPNTWLPVSAHHGWLKLLAGYVDSPSALAIKVVARYPQHPPGQNLGGLCILFDPTCGFPVAIFDSVYITGVRTGAGGGLATQCCARPDARTVGILGSGVQARFTLLAICAVMPQVERALVYSRQPARRATYAQEMAAATGRPCLAVETPRAAVADADIIVTATNSPTPVLLPDWIKPGVHINAMGIKTEIHPGVFPGARVYGDAVDVATTDGKFSTAIQAGTVRTTEIAGEIGDVLLGRKPGRVTPEEVTIFDSDGLAVQDVVCALYVYEKARKHQLGTYVDFGLADMPYA
jgi:alanine dehydrogenase